VLPDAIDAVAAARQIADAHARLTRLERQATRCSSPWVDAAAARARGAVLVADGDPEAALEHLQRAEATFQALGFRPDAARASLLLGEALRASGSRTPAAARLRAARDAFTAIGATTWAARAASALEATAPGSGRGELTDVEQAVIALIATGKRNRDVAAELFMSVSSVEAHLTRVYRKLGVRSRIELIRRAADPDGEAHPTPRAVDEGRSGS
jgi:DNA-binding NarL/FixJ family response regulator